MARIKIGFNGKPVETQIEESRDKVIKMTGNVNFTTPRPSLASLTTAIDDLEEAYLEAFNGDREKIRERYLKSR